MAVWLAVALGGLVGSVARHGVNVAFAHALGRAEPYSTAAVNIAGSFAVGVLTAWAVSGRWTSTAATRAFVFTGLLGGFTTFSSFMLDTLTLSQGASRSLAIANLIGQVVLGVVAVFAGYYAVR